MAQRVVRLALLVGGTNVAWFAFIVLAGRRLDPEAFGSFNLCVSAATLMVAAGDFGLTSTLARWFSSRDLGGWDWLFAFRRAAPVAGLIVFAGSVLLSLAYRVPWPLAAVTGLAALAGIVLRAMGAGLLRAHGRAMAGALVEKGFRLLLPAVAGVLLVAGLGGEVTGWLLAWATVVVGAALLAILISGRLPRGRRPLEEAYWSGAWLFWLMSGLYLASTYLDRLLIPARVELSALGEYAAVANLLLGFDVLTVALSYLLLPRLGRSQEVSLRREFVVPIGFGLAGGAAFVVLGPWLLHVLFDGTYDAAASLVPGLAVVGLLRVAYVVPSTVIATRFQRPHLLALFAVSVVLFLLHAGLLWSLLPSFGTMGAVLANLVVAGLRLVLVIPLVMHRLAQERSPSIAEAS